jgi:hypothetical protein
MPKDSHLIDTINTVFVKFFEADFYMPQDKNINGDIPRHLRGGSSSVLIYDDEEIPLIAAELNSIAGLRAFRPC